MVGIRVGRLVVLSRGNNNEKGCACWLVRCDCGTEKSVPGTALRDGSIKSCGCYRIDELKGRSFRHGFSGTPSYNIWAQMRNRCSRPNVRGYKDYGGRGIKVCERWESFLNFLADMGECPPGKSIDRIDNNGNYEPGNCRWATLVEQTNNRRTNRILELGGKKMTMAQWAVLTGLKYPVIQGRLRLGWTIERTLTTPSRGSL